MARSETSSATSVASPRPATCMTKLRYYLDEHGISMAWVAKQVSINYDRFYRLCAGVNEPTLREALALKRLLLCELEEIFDTDEALPGDGSDHD